MAATLLWTKWWNSGSEQAEDERINHDPLGSHGRHSLKQSDVIALQISTFPPQTANFPAMIPAVLSGKQSEAHGPKLTGAYYAETQTYSVLQPLSFV